MLIPGTQYPVRQDGEVPSDSRTTIWTTWGNDIIAVSADWSEASCQIEGDSHGRQVAEFCHHPNAALRAALEDKAQSEGLPLDYSRLQIDRAMDSAVHEDRYVAAYHAR